MTTKEWLGIAAVALGLGTSAYNLVSSYLEHVQQHAIEDKKRDDELVRLLNRVSALEQIDYKEHPAYALDIYYANGEVERVKVRRP